MIFGQNFSKKVRGERVNDKLKAGIIILTETKIDSSYMDTQFSLPNYRIYRQDRAKAGGGVLTFIAAHIPSKKLKPPRLFESIEVLAIKLELNNTNTILLGMYRPPHCRGTNYYWSIGRRAERLSFLGHNAMLHSHHHG